MAILGPGDLLIGDVLLTARAAALSPRYALVATDPRLTIAERVEAARSASVMAVALSQPHRQGNASRHAGDALKAFCRRHRLRDECFEAGEKYDREARAEKSARGFHVVDQAPGEPENLDEGARDAKIELAIMNFRASNAVLAQIHRRCPRAMELLCYDRLPVAPENEAMLVNGLLNLARHYALLDEGINRDKLATVLTFEIAGEKQRLP
jgi:hypothetical protein